MKTWETELVSIKEIGFDHDLHHFEVYANITSGMLGTIEPESIEDMNQIIADLDDGACPIADHWEDGNGNTCTLDGWNGYGDSGN